MKLLKDKLLNKVREVLIERSQSKDDDRFLTCAIWWREIQKKKEGITPDEGKYNTVSFIEFLEMYHKGKLTLADSITRARRKLQEEDKTLRGKNWYKRKNRQEEVRQEIIEYKYH